MRVFSLDRGWLSIAGREFVVNRSFVLRVFGIPLCVLYLVEDQHARYDVALESELEAVVYDTQKGE
jgi:hypothetical protein